MSLTDVATVGALLGETLTGDDATRATTLIGLVQAEIEGHLGRPAEGGTAIVDEVHTIGPITDLLHTKLWPVTSVEAVTEAGTDLTEDVDYIVELDTGTIRRITNGVPQSWDYSAGGVLVDYTPATIAQLATLTASITARAFRAGRAANAATTSKLDGLKQLTIGRWSATAANDRTLDPATALALTEDERRTVQRYIDRRP